MYPDGRSFRRDSWRYNGRNEKKMKFSKHELEILKNVVKKIEQEKRDERIHISIRRKSQLKGKTINKRIQKKKKAPQNRRKAKRRASIR